jgi:hypothetical protein
VTTATGFFRTKLWLWTSIAATLVVAVGYIPIAHIDGESFSYWACWGVVLRGGAFVGTPADTGLILSYYGGLWGLVLTAAGWVVHRLLLAALFRGSIRSDAVQGSSVLRVADRPRHWRTFFEAAIVMASLAAPFAACGLAWLRTPPLPKAVLEYPDGVKFVCGEVAWWFAPDTDNPGPCPLTVHLPGVDLDAAALASTDQMRELGWEVSVLHRDDDGKVYSEEARSPGRVVECTYIRGRLVSVQVGMGTNPVPGQPPPQSVAVSLGGRRVALPSSREAIIAALGPPLAEK